MESVVLVIHLILAFSLVVIVLIQRSEGGGLGIGGGQGGMGSFASVRGTASFLSRATALLALGFIVTSLTLAILSGAHDKPVSILDVSVEENVIETEDGLPKTVLDEPDEPSVPIGSEE